MEKTDVATKLLSRLVPGSTCSAAILVIDTGEGHRAAALSSLPREPPPLTCFHRPGLNSNATPPHGGFRLTIFFVMVCTKAQASDVEIC